MIAAVLEDPHSDWFLAEYQCTAAGQCAVSLVRSSQRFCHRASLSLLVLQEYWGLGIGSQMIQQCICWCQERGVTQLELEVVAGNIRAVALYQRFGFQISGIIPNALRYPDGSCADEYFMVKYL